jgi:hypothetical protein
MFVKGVWSSTACSLALLTTEFIDFSVVPLCANKLKDIGETKNIV